MIDRKKIVELREKNGYTQYELAKAADISVVTLNKIETSDEAKPFNRTLIKIATALGVTVEDLSDNAQEIDKDIFSTVNDALKDRNKVIASIMGIDSFMFSYITKQLDIFRRDLGNVFGISDTMLVEAALFSGVSWSRPGNTTHESNYPKVLGDLLALQNKKIDIKRENIQLRTIEEIEKYKGIPGIYGICDNDGNLLRVGETKKGLSERLIYHIKALQREEYPAMKEYISTDDVFGEHYFFCILAFEPKYGRQLTALQSDTWRYYAETKLIIEEKTFLTGNRHNGKGIFTGDIYIPIKVQKEMINYYYGYEV